MNLLALVARLQKFLEYLQSEPKVYPDTAVGVEATAAAGGAFARGAYVQIVPASTITTRMRPNAIIISNPSAADEWEIDIATGSALSEVDVGTFKFNGAETVVIPCIAEIDANVRIACRIGCFDAVARTAEVSLGYIDTLTP
tara:strand:- start:393 stop:818 length:426 start_codon:yes stop_codon:yes gene_type:complete